MKRLFFAALLLFCLPSVADPAFGRKLAQAAYKQIGVTRSYDPAYRKLAYPGGDVPIETGVCTDVVIRAYREYGIDLQKLIHEDMKGHFSAYPKLWGLTRTDKNIDHRRVQNMATFFRRHGSELPYNDFRPGDIITWNLKENGSMPHVGIVSTKKLKDGTPLIIHNIGNGTMESNILRAYTMTGHYRYGGKPASR